MLAFGLRRMHGVGLTGTGWCWPARGAGAIVGLVLVGRLRKRMTEQQLLLSLALADRGNGGRLRRLGHAVRPGGPGLHGRPVRRGGPAVLRRHDPALHPAVRPGPRLRPLRHAPAAGLGGGLADPGDHRRSRCPRATPPWRVLAALGGLSYVSGRAGRPDAAGHAARLSPRPGQRDGWCRQSPGAAARSSARSSAQALLERVDLVGQRLGQPVAELA